MKRYIQRLSEISSKIENYNITIQRIKNILGENYEEVLEYILSKELEFPVKHKIYNSIVLALNCNYNGWFESIDLVRSWNTFIHTSVNESQKRAFTIDDVKRILTNDYTTEYSRCYKTGELNEEEYLDLVIKIIELKLLSIYEFQMNLYSIKNNINSDNKVIKLQNSVDNENVKLCMYLKMSTDTDEDLVAFKNILNKLYLIKQTLTYSSIQKKYSNLTDEDISKLDILLHVLPLYKLTVEEIDFINLFLSEDIATQITTGMENNTTIDIGGMQKVKK